MKFFFLLITILFSTFLLSSLDMNNELKQDPEKALSAFPKAKEGMVRYVIFLDQKSDESLYKVEIIPGKILSVDCNHHSLVGSLKEKKLQRWGYTYFEFTSEGKTVSTMMACYKPDINKFITGQTIAVRYNSKLPVVIYAPKGFEVKYRIWQAGKEQKINRENKIMKISY